MRLSHHDLDALSKSIRSLYAETDLERLPNTIIALLAKLIPCDSVSYNEYEPLAERLLVIIAPELTGLRERLPAFEHSFQEHPVAAHFQRTSSLAAFKISDFYSKQQYLRTGIYNEFYRYFDVTHQMSVFVSHARERQICMAFNRKGRDFSGRDRQVLEALRPHLTQALANARAAGVLMRNATFLADAVDSSAQGLAWIDRAGKTLFITARAQAWLTEYFGPITPNSSLPCHLRAWLKLQFSIINLVREPLLVAKGAKILRVRVVEQGPRLLLIFTERADRIDSDRFLEQGLTLREIEVFRWIAEGKSNPEIGTILGLSSRTVDKHVERIFAKLNIENRKSAMLLAWKADSCESS